MNFVPQKLLFLIFCCSLEQRACFTKILCEGVNALFGEVSKHFGGQHTGAELGTNAATFFRCRIQVDEAQTATLPNNIFHLDVRVHQVVGELLVRAGVARGAGLDQVGAVNWRVRIVAREDRVGPVAGGAVRDLPVEAEAAPLPVVALTERAALLGNTVRQGWCLRGSGAGA